MKFFPDLSDVVAEKRLIRKRRQRYEQKADMVKLNRLTNLIHKKNSKFEDLQAVCIGESLWKSAKGFKNSRNISNSSIQG